MKDDQSNHRGERPMTHARGPSLAAIPGAHKPPRRSCGLLLAALLALMVTLPAEARDNEKSRPDSSASSAGSAEVTDTTNDKNTRRAAKRYGRLSQRYNDRYGAAYYDDGLSASWAATKGYVDIDAFDKKQRKAAYALREAWFDYIDSLDR